jgi:Na+-transporting NADH:ubiquinone oxidoreductase subunit NqrA
MQDTNSNLAEPATLALQALGWVLSDESRASRLLALTGLSPEILRDALAERSTQAAILGFLENHEPDLIACSQAIGAKPEALVAARRELEA